MTRPPIIRPWICGVLDPQRMTHAQVTIFRRADHSDAQGAREQFENARALPQLRHFGCDVPQVKGQAWRNDGIRRPAASRAGGRVQQAETASGGVDAGHCGAGGRRLKKLLTLDDKRKAVQQMMNVHEPSERWACQLADLDRSTRVMGQRKSLRYGIRLPDFRFRRRIRTMARNLNRLRREAPDESSFFRRNRAVYGKV